MRCWRTADGSAPLVHCAECNKPLRAEDGVYLLIRDEEGGDAYRAVFCRECATHVRGCWRTADGSAPVSNNTLVALVASSVAGAVCIPARRRRTKPSPPGSSATGEASAPFSGGVENRRHAAWAEQPVGLRLPPGQLPLRNSANPQRRSNTYSRSSARPAESFHELHQSRLSVMQARGVAIVERDSAGRKTRRSNCAPAATGHHEKKGSCQSPASARAQLALLVLMFWLTWWSPVAGPMPVRFRTTGPGLRSIAAHRADATISTQTGKSRPVHKPADSK
jgi:hypothetical protein